ncbi:MAG: hypothetical protein ACI39R_00560 [Lachnospiraceae bacterium]
MIGLIYFLLCILVGFTIIHLLFPDIYGFVNKTYTGKKLEFPAFMLVFPATVTTGILSMVWPTYLLACLFSETGKALSYANAIVMPVAILFVVMGQILINNKRKDVFSGLFRGGKDKDLFFFGFVTALASFMMFLTFYVSDGNLGVGISVFSDFAPHMGMIRSFSKGNNFPTGYSHFAGADIKYHFMFQFFVGNLEYLGLRIDWAFNLPSIVCFVCVCMLLYTLAVKLFGKRSVGMLSVLFFLFRSGSAFTTYLSEIDGKFKDIIKTLEENTTYIGKTVHEDWGLWNLNVYVNQRHLAIGMCILLIVLLLMLEPVFCSLKRTSTKIKETVQKKGDSFFIKAGCFVRELVFRKAGWIIKDYKTCIFCGLLLGFGAFFNGACVIACLLVLFILAFITDRRLEYLVTALIAVFFSSLETWFFIDGSVVEFRWEPGFLAEVKTFFGTIDYLNILLGILPFVLLMAFLMVNGYYKWILVAFITPIVFAVTFQMTVDVAVNHKYIMVGCMLADVFAAAFVYRVFAGKGLANKPVAILLIIMLTCTGVYDFNVMIKKNAPENDGSLLYSLEDPLTEWICDNSDAEDIFLTDWYSLNNVVLGGAMLYYGWPYYAWSAGYDTSYREAQVKLMYEAGDSRTLTELIDQNNIRFIIVDNSARHNENYYVREDVISNTFACVYSQGEGEWQLNIYDTTLR